MNDTVQAMFSTIRRSFDDTQSARQTTAIAVHNGTHTVMLQPGGCKPS